MESSKQWLAGNSDGTKSSVTASKGKGRISKKSSTNATASVPQLARRPAQSTAKSSTNNVPSLPISREYVTGADKRKTPAKSTATVTSSQTRASIILHSSDYAAANQTPAARNANNKKGSKERKTAVAATKAPPPPAGGSTTWECPVSPFAPNFIIVGSYSFLNLNPKPIWL